MFPLKKRKIGGYTFKQKTFYSAHHLGTDYSANKNTLYAPFDGKIIRSFYGTQGGNTIWFQPYGRNDIIRFMHLSWRLGTGEHKEGDIIGKTGNTGKYTKAPHLHLDISRNKVQINNINNFVDPEKYNWESDKKTMNKKLTKAIKKYLFDFGKKLNDKEAEKVAKEIKKLYNERNDLRTELINEQSKPKLSYKREYDNIKSQLVFLSNKLNETKRDYSKEILELKDKVSRQKKEITLLKAINEKNAKEASFWKTFVFLIKTAIK